MSATFHIERDRSERYWRLRLHGIFDGTSAWELRRAIARLGRRHPVAIDFSGVTELHEFGVATLAAGLLARRWPPLQFVGVDAERRGLLRRYGLELDKPYAPWPPPHPVMGLISPAREEP